MIEAWRRPKIGLETGENGRKTSDGGLQVRDAVEGDDKVGGKGVLSKSDRTVSERRQRCEDSAGRIYLDLDKKLDLLADEEVKVAQFCRRR